jgi:hypothetical protein
MRIVVSALLLLSLWSCQTTTPDPLCQNVPLPDASDVPAGQGAIQILASTEETFYVFDQVGKQVASAGTNRSAAVKPGDYVVKINKSSRSVSVSARRLTKCSTGGVLVSGTTDETYYVFDTANTQLSYAGIAKALALFPGSYQVRMNKTTASVDIRPGATVELKAGTLSVPGTTEETFYVNDSLGTQLSYSRVGKPLSLLAGSYKVTLNKTEGPAQIRPGQTTEIPSGTLLLRGTTDETYYVFNNAGTQLSYAKLSTPLSLLPGTYTLKVNKTSTPISVEAGKTSEYQTGTLTVKGTGDNTYYVLDTQGTQLSYNKLNQPLSLLAGNYTVKLGKETRPVAIAAGGAMILNW